MIYVSLCILRKKYDPIGLDSDSSTDENVPIITVTERQWISHPNGFRTLFHGVEMPLVSDDDDSEDENDDIEESQENTS